MIRSRATFLLWVLPASLLLLEGVLQLGALFVNPDRADADAPIVKQRDAFRVLAVGDSWVYGAEAPRGRGFVDVVAQELPAVLGRPVQVVNLGRNGGNSAHAASVALSAVPALDPHAIIALVGLNNGHNLQGTAELEQRVGGRRGVRLRSVQALRIAAYNLGLGRSSVALPPVPPMRFEDDGACLHGNFAFGDLADADAAQLCRGTPIVSAPLLDSDAGRGYLERFVDDAPPPTGDALDDLAYFVLYAAARGEAERVAAQAEALEAQLTGTIRGPVDARARYALLRWAREVEDWRAVRRHGGVLDAWPDRGLLRDLGAAEARILAGDWPTARALLLSAHHRAPGFADVVDLASRFPEPARDGRVHDAIEWPWPRRSLPREARRAASIPGLYYSPGFLDALETAVQGRDPGPTPAPGAHASEWRAHLAGHAGRGGDGVAPAVRALLRSASAADPVALGYALRALGEDGDCALILEVAERWYASRGDAHGFVRGVAPCLDGRAAAGRVSELRKAWGPLGDPADWDALVGAGHRSFALLERHLDLIADAAPDARLLVLTYANPHDGFGMHRDAVLRYGRGRAVEIVDMQGLFAERFSPAEWEALLAPGGHCNERGYRVMGEEVVRRLAADPTAPAR